MLTELSLGMQNCILSGTERVRILFLISLSVLCTSPRSSGAPSCSSKAHAYDSAPPPVPLPRSVSSTRRSQPVLTTPLCPSHAPPTTPYSTSVRPSVLLHGVGLFWAPGDSHALFRRSCLPRCIACMEELPVPYSTCARGGASQGRTARLKVGAR